MENYIPKPLHFEYTFAQTNTVFMKFGKLPSITNVDFSLPPDPPGNASLFFNKEKSDEEKTLYIGATGWGMKEWVGSVYPKDAKPKDYLQHYANQFNTIELNSTHYGIPSELTIQKWHEQSTADFRFCPKVLQKISHSRDLSPAGPVNLTRQFCEAMLVFKEKLGPCFIQLPPHFGADRLETLIPFLERWQNFGITLAVEVRHESWFEGNGSLNDLAEVLTGLGMPTVITDVAGRRDVCHMHLTADEVVVRFVGNGLHPTDFARIDAWVERMGIWFDNGMRNAYFFTHEPENVLAPELAVYLAKKAAKLEGVSTRGPNLAPPSQESQLSLF